MDESKFWEEYKRRLEELYDKLGDLADEEIDMFVSLPEDERDEVAQKYEAFIYEVQGKYLERVKAKVKASGLH